MTTDREIEEIQKRMIQHAIDQLIAAGHPPEQAREMALAALNAPSSFEIPTLDELDCLPGSPNANKQCFKHGLTNPEGTRHFQTS